MESRPFDWPIARESARSIPVGRGTFDHNLRFLTVDETLAALHGLPAVALLGQPLSAALPTLEPVIAPLLTHVLTTGEPILDVDVRGELPNGNHCRWLASYYPVATRSGSVIAVECAVYALDQRAPFTTLATAHAALHQATNQLVFQATILANLNDAVVAVDVAGNITYWGPGAERLYGFAVGEVLNRRLREVIHYQWADPAAEQPALTLLREGGFWRGELRHVARGGAPLTVEASVSALTNALGQITGYLSINRDITDRRRVEEALRVSEERFRTIQELSLDGIAIMRSLYADGGAVVDFTCTYLNPVAERLVGHPLAQVQGLRMAEVFPGVVTNGLLDRYIQVYTSGEPQVFEQHYAADGIDAWYRNMVIRIDDGLAISFGDITAQKQGEVALRASEERFRQFAAAVDAVFWIADPAQRRLLYISPAYERIMGRSSAALYADFMEWIAAIHPDDQERVASAFFERVYTGTYEEEFRVVRPDGSVRWVRDRGFPIADDNGTIVRVAGIAEDITQPKEHEIQIELQAQMLDAVGRAVIASDPDGIIRYWNRGAEELYGWSSAEARGWHAAALLVSAPDRPQFDEIVAQVRQGLTWTGEAPVYCRDGTRLDVLSTRSPVYDAQGRLIGMISVSVDITRRKQVELQQSHLLEFASALAEALTVEQVIAVIFAKVYRVIDAQAGAVALLGADGHSVELIKTLLDPSAQGVATHRLDLDMPFPVVDVIQSGQAIWISNPEELMARYPRLQEFLPDPCACAALPLTIPQRTIGALGMIFARPREFSPDDQIYLQLAAHQCAQALERARLYEAERRARLAAEDAVHMRDELLSMVSHDLRNPLMVILGQAQLMVRQAQSLGDQGQSLVPRLAVIRDMVGQMNGQLEDLLDAARLRAGQTLVLDLRPLALEALVQDVVQATQATCRRHVIQLTMPDVTILCLADRRRLMLVFENLLSNAVTYSPAGGQVLVRVTSVTDDNGMWGAVSIQDAGVGIPAADLPRIFERFYRGANVSGHIQGTGLGLASARQIVEQHEGRIAVTSVEAVGSTFTVYLPCADEA